ncbi:MAG: ATP-binding protein, partial [Myxococcaceae bacterium]
RFAFGLIVGAINNIIDNSLYWMRVRWPEVPPQPEPSPRKLYIGTSDEFEAGPAIVIADTGPGFEDTPDRLVRPFFTRKPNGMGLGLGGARRLVSEFDIQSTVGSGTRVSAVRWR